MKINSARVVDKGLYIKTDKGQTATIPMPKEVAQYLVVLIVKDQLPRFPLPKRRRKKRRKNTTEK